MRVIAAIRCFSVLFWFCCLISVGSAFFGLHRLVGWGIHAPPPPPCSWVLWRPGDLVIPGLIGADQLRQKSGLLPLNRVRPSEQRLDQLLRSLGQGFGRVSRHGGVGGECFYSLPAFCLFGIPCGSRFTDYGFL